MTLAKYLSRILSAEIGGGWLILVSGGPSVLEVLFKLDLTPVNQSS